MAPILTNSNKWGFGSPTTRKQSVWVAVCEHITIAGEMIQRENPITEYSSNVIFG